MRWTETASLLFLAMARVLKAPERSVRTGAKGAGSRACPDATFIPDPGPDEQRHAPEAASPEKGGARDTGPPPDWLRRTQRGAPEHWLALVRKHAPQLLEPVAGRDDGVYAMHGVTGTDGLEPMGALAQQPDPDPEDIRALQGLPPECGDRESEALHPEKGAVPVRRGETAQAQPETERLDRSATGAPKKMWDRGSALPLAFPSQSLKDRRHSQPWEEAASTGVSQAEACATPPGLVKTVAESCCAEARRCPSRRMIRARDTAERGSGLSRDPGEGASSGPRSEPVPRSETTSRASPCAHPTNWESTADPTCRGKRGSRTAGFEFLSDPSESSQVTDQRGVRRLLPAPRVSDPEESPPMWENLLESLTLSSSPGFPAEPSARRWPELMEERDMDFHDHRAVFDDRERRERLMQEQDGAPWSA
jgi:hypothetical protein